MIRRVYIEITNICNLRCSFCRKSSREPRSMSTGEFSRILSQVKELTDYIYLHVQGEPLLHPSFGEIMDLCDEAGMKVQLVTNGTLLSHFPDLTAHTSLRRLSVSLQSLPFQPDLTEAYTDTVISLCRRASLQKRPYVDLRFWRSEQFGDELTDSVLAKIRAAMPLWEKTSRKNSIRLAENVYLSSDNSFSWPDPDAGADETYGTCHGALDQIAILSDGSVVPCCLDCDGIITFGNVFQQNLHEILAGKRYTEMCEGLRRHYLTEDLCRACTFRRRFR